jgi:hypothetical protein
VASLRGSLLDRYFYFLMALLVAAVVVVGFGHTAGARLLHPAVPPPTVLYVHAVVFIAWVLFFIFQSALVRTKNVAIHVRTGWFGVALGALMPFLGIWTAIVMTRFRNVHYPDPGNDVFMIVPFLDVLCFSVTFALAIYWRGKPEFHRRLILLATCALTAAAFGRFPHSILPGEAFYAGVDALILLGVLRDLLVEWRVHVVYAYGLPAFMLGQFAAMYMLLSNSPAWEKIAHAIAG